MTEITDPTFYRTPADAIAAAPESLAYVAAFDPGGEAKGGIALLDHETFDVVSAWEADRGEQYFGYDVWWHLNHDTVITSEWATPSMFEGGLNPEDLLGRKFGHHLNFWSMSGRKLQRRIDLGDEHQMVFEVRPAHDPAQTWGFVGVVINVEH